MRFKGVRFPEAVRIAVELSGVPGSPGTQAISSDGSNGQAVVAEGLETSPEPLSGLTLTDATVLFIEAAERLWSPDGVGALAYLRGRGLTEETIQKALLGVLTGVPIPTRSGSHTRVTGIVIPWLNQDLLTLLKIRPPDGSRPKYLEVYRHRPAIYPSPSVVRPARPIVIVEGELDALLLGQILADRASVITLGSASNHPDSTILRCVLPGFPWFIATDNDPAGEAAAQRWLGLSQRARRVRPPGSSKDWTEAHQARVNLYRWWSERLAGVETPRLFTWEELSTWRWGPALSGQADAGDPVDTYAVEERLAIQAESADSEKSWQFNMEVDDV
jgi:hypothetical protein